jgi:hypothetical protein
VKKQVHLDDRAKAVPNGDPVKRGVQNPGVASQMQPCGFDRYVHGRNSFQAELTILEDHFELRAAPKLSIGNYSPATPSNPSCSEKTSLRNSLAIPVFDDGITFVTETWQ